MEDQLTFPQIVDGLSAPVATITPDGRVDLVTVEEITGRPAAAVEEFIARRKDLFAR